MGTNRTRPRTTSVTFVIPWRYKGDPNRLANSSHVINYLESLNLGTVIVATDGRTGTAPPFNRCAAYNRGRAKWPSDVYVWHEADMIVPREQLEAGIEAALDTNAYVVPFDKYNYLGPEDTALVRDGKSVHDVNPEWTMPDGKSIGAVGITTEATMQLVGQWDETFEGWGYDDNAMHHAFNICAGQTGWIEGPAWHLYHTPGWSPDLFDLPHAQQVSDVDRAATQANKQRLALYQRTYTAEGIRALTAGTNAP